MRSLRSSCLGARPRSAGARSSSLFLSLTGTPARVVALGLALGGPGCVGSLDEEERARFGFGGSGDGGARPDLGGPACPDVLATILASSDAPKGCAQAACHSAGVASQGLDLESADLVTRLSGQASSSCGGEVYIDPMDPADSLIYKKIGPGPYPCGGSRMPIGATLTDPEIACVLAFIEREVGGPVDAGVPDSGSADAGATDTGPTDTGAPDAGASPEIELEAETMTLTPPFVVEMDGGASGGQYITQPSGSLNADPDATDVGRATVSFDLAEAGMTRIFGRVRAASSDNDSFWVRVDQGAWVRWNDLAQASSGDWAWDDVHDSDNMPGEPRIFDLTAGTHTLEFAFREPNAQLDRLILTQDPGFTPPD